MASNMCKLSLIVAMILLVTVAAYPSRPSYIRCTSSEDCSPEECCVLGMMRYSVPLCKPLANEGDVCRPLDDNPSQNLTLSYPDGSSVNVNVHMITCPCAAGLDCFSGMTCSGLEGLGNPMLREDYTDVDEINHL